MNNLTATELRIFNNLSKVHDPDVELGQEIQDIISTIPVADTPVNAVGSYTELTMSDVVVHGETLTIDNPAVEGSDVYELLADAAQEVATEGNIAVDIQSAADKAAVTLTVDTQPTSGDTMTIGSTVYTFVPNGTANSSGEVTVGTDLATAQAAIVAAINGTDGHNLAHADVSAAAFSGNDSVITAFIGGVAGNSIDSTETFDEGTNVFSALTLEDGTDCSAAGSVAAFVTAIDASDTQGVDPNNETGGVLSLTADVLGVIGDLIEVANTISNGTFTGATDVLENGVDGTPGLAGALMVDGSYLYYLDAENTIADANWVRASVTWAAF